MKTFPRILCVCISMVLLTSCTAHITVESEIPPSSSSSISSSSQSNAAIGQEGPGSSSVASLEGMSLQQLEDLENYIYDWYFFCPDPVSSPDEIPRDAKMLRFICQQTWVRKLAIDETLNLVGDPDWQIAMLPAAEVEHMYTDILGDNEGFSLLPKTPLPCSVDDLESQLKNLDFATITYYLPNEEAFLCPAVYGQDLSTLESIDISISGDVLAGVIRGNNLERTYSFEWDEDAFPCLTLISIQ